MYSLYGDALWSQYMKAVCTCFGNKGGMSGCNCNLLHMMLFLPCCSDPSPKSSVVVLKNPLPNTWKVILESKILGLFSHLKNNIHLISSNFVRKRGGECMHLLNPPYHFSKLLSCPPSVISFLI